eukprot:13663-Heterococcus_DN1.PRE.2
MSGKGQSAAAATAALVICTCEVKQRDKRQLVAEQTAVNIFAWPASRAASCLLFQKSATRMCSALRIMDGLALVGTKDVPCMIKGARSQPKVSYFSIALHCACMHMVAIA